MPNLFFRETMNDGVFSRLNGESAEKFTQRFKVRTYSRMTSTISNLDLISSDIAYSGDLRLEIRDLEIICRLFLLDK